MVLSSHLKKDGYTHSGHKGMDMVSNR